MSRRKLGQHFLSRGSILERIAAAACPVRQDLVVEIGPGRGALTEKLLQRAARVVAIEVDPLLVEHLRLKFAAEPRLEIVCADVLETDLAQWGRAAIAGNLPYYIASPILEKVLLLNPPRAVFLIQKEVAERLVARPGDREYGYLTVRTALVRPRAPALRGEAGGFPPAAQSRFRRGAAGAAHRRPGRARPRRLPALRRPMFPPKAQDAPQQPGRLLRKGSGRCLARSLPPRRTNLARRVRRNVPPAAPATLS